MNEKPPDPAKQTLGDLAQERKEHEATETGTADAEPAHRYPPRGPDKKKRARWGSKKRAAAADRPSPPPRITIAPEPDPLERIGIDRETVKEIIKLPYTVLASVYGKHWELSDGEADRMILPHVKLAERYLPETMREQPALYACLFMHGLALFVRYGAHVRLQRELAAAAETATDGPAEPLHGDPGEAGYGKIYPSPVPDTVGTQGPVV